MIDRLIVSALVFFSFVVPCASKGEKRSLTLLSRLIREAVLWDDKRLM